MVLSLVQDWLVGDITFSCYFGLIFLRFANALIPHGGSHVQRLCRSCRF